MPAGCNDAPLALSFFSLHFPYLLLLPLLNPPALCTGLQPILAKTYYLLVMIRLLLCCMPINLSAIQLTLLVLHRSHHRLTVSPRTTPMLLCHYVMSKISQGTGLRGTPFPFSPIEACRHTHTHSLTHAHAHAPEPRGRVSLCRRRYVSAPMNPRGYNYLICRIVREGKSVGHRKT